MRYNLVDEEGRLKVRPHYTKLISYRDFDINHLDYRFRGDVIRERWILRRVIDTSIFIEVYLDEEFQNLYADVLCFNYTPQEPSYFSIHPFDLVVILFKNHFTLMFFY